MQLTVRLAMVSTLTVALTLPLAAQPPAPA